MLNLRPIEPAGGDLASGRHDGRDHARAHSLLVNRIRHAVEKQRIRHKDKKPMLWSTTHGGRLGVKIRTQLLAEGLKALTNKSFAEIASTISKRISKPPQRGAGPSNPGERTGIDGRPDWTEKTIHSWLLNREVSPSNEFAERMISILAKLLQEQIDGRSASPRSVAEIIEEKNLSVDEVLQKVFAGVELPQTVSALSDLKSWAGPGLKIRPDAAEPQPLEEAAEEAKLFLEMEGGPRAVFISGVPHSGKKTALRYFFHGLSNGNFRLDEGMSLAVLAIALDDHTPEDFVDRVFNFYRRGHFSSFISDENSAELSLASKIEQIAAMAAATPACILIGDLAPIDEDEIVRAFSRDHIGQLISCLFKAHPQTRLLLTMKEAKNSLAGRASISLEHVKIVELPSKLRLSSDVRTSGLTALIAEDKKLSGLSWRLGQIAYHLAHTRLRAAGEQSRFNKQLRVCLQSDSPMGLLVLIWDRLLSTEERCLVGIVASSQDGVRVSVLSRVVTALAQLDPKLGLDPRMTHINNLISGLDRFVESRSVTVEPLLRMELLSREETLFSLDNGWRRHFLRLWWQSDVPTARLVHWLIAREAADQSRKIRSHGLVGGGSSSFGRDIQTFHALVASVDAAAVISGQAKITTDLAANSRNGGDGAANLEALILPPLDIHADVPDPKLVLRYCYFELYTKDLQGPSARLFTVLDDAQTRLGLLLSLFNPEIPWVPASERKLSATLGAYGHFLSTFEPKHQVDILAGIAIAALRVENYGLLSNAVRLGEEIYRERRGVGISTINFMRLLRTKVDAGLLLGGDPDAIRVIENDVALDLPARRHDVQLTAVAAGINDILQNVLPASKDCDRDLTIARGKLLARLGEVYHVAGKLSSARNEFRKALELERNVCEAAGYEAFLAPVIGGRGARSRLRMLIDIAKRVHRKSGFSEFIFADQLALPIPLLVSASDPLIVEAHRMNDLNARRMSRNRAADAIGLKVDSARLAVLNHDFQKAYALLDRADALKFAPGASPESLLELTAVKTRYLIDGAALCFNMNAANSIFSSGMQIAKIADYLCTDLQRGPEAVAAILIERAKRSGAAFQKLVTLQKQVPYPYATYFEYLEGLRLAVESRQTDVDVESLLRKAATHTTKAIDQMMESAYGMHLREASRFRRSLCKALDYYAGG